MSEHVWHACRVPPRPDRPATWKCKVCDQVWRWLRPPRPAAQWVRQDPDDKSKCGPNLH